MKKTAICLMAALGLTAVSLTSCDNIKPVSELTNASDSLVYAVGVLTGNDVNNGIKNLGQPVDIDQFMKGAKKALYSDSTAFSYEVGFSFASGIKQQLKQMSEQLGITVDKDVYLSNGNKGYVFFHRDVERTKFNETRDYHYPIPINERSLNPNLTQNPGWNDGLDF